MEFTFVTDYDSKGLTAMARGLRKTVRKRHSRRTRIFAAIVLAFGLLLSWPGETIDARNIVTWAVLAIMVLVMVFEDRLNAFFSRKRMIPGTEHARSVFTEENFRSETDVGTTEWKYDKVTAMAETRDYFVFLYGKNHAQIHDKRTLTGGTVEEFRTFLQEKTEKKICLV